MQQTEKTWVQSLGREDPLEEVVATHSSIPAWRIPWTEEPGGLQTAHGVAELDTTEMTSNACTAHTAKQLNYLVLDFFFLEDSSYVLSGINQESDYKYSQHFLWMEGRVPICREIVRRREFPESLLCL